MSCWQWILAPSNIQTECDPGYCWTFDCRSKANRRQYSTKVHSVSYTSKIPSDPIKHKQDDLIALPNSPRYPFFLIMSLPSKDTSSKNTSCFHAQLIADSSSQKRMTSFNWIWIARRSNTFHVRPLLRKIVWIDEMLILMPKCLKKDPSLLPEIAQIENYTVAIDIIACHVQIFCTLFRRFPFLTKTPRSHTGWSDNFDLSNPKK